MSVQTSYSQATPRGVAGGLVDLSAHVVNTRLNGETGNAMKFGLGVVRGPIPGSDVAIPVAGATADKFEGVVINGGTSELDMSGKLNLPPTASLSVMQYGKIWTRTKAGVNIAYGDSLHLVITGDDAGKFTNAADGVNTIAVKGRFIGGKGTGDIAPVELYNQANV